mmetsp:Transcript_103455/g.292057  ORF Transcript_103455/g.292057 Transcript_103455/m.292057 type:complete len:254 (+) Transcript_103455:2525-3286(+)
MAPNVPQLAIVNVCFPALALTVLRHVQEAILSGLPSKDRVVRDRVSPGHVYPLEAVLLGEHALQGLVRRAYALERRRGLRCAGRADSIHPNNKNLNIPVLAAVVMATDLPHLAVTDQQLPALHESALAIPANEGLRACRGCSRLDGVVWQGVAFFDRQPEKVGRRPHQHGTFLFRLFERVAPNVPGLAVFNVQLATVAALAPGHIHRAIAGRLACLDCLDGQRIASANWFPPAAVLFGSHSQNDIPHFAGEQR